jgi:hypothetical protein
LPVGADASIAAEGRTRAKARGKHIGRPPSLTPKQQKEATRRRAQGATLQELADSHDRSISTMRRATRAPFCILRVPFRPRQVKELPSFKWTIT